MRPGWPARAGAGNLRGRGSAPRAAGCSSWTHKPWECRGSQWCSPLPPTVRGNDIRPDFSSMREHFLRYRKSKHHINRHADEINFISSLHCGPRRRLPTHEFLDSSSSTVSHVALKYILLPLVVAEIESFLCNTPVRWAKGSTAAARTKMKNVRVRLLTLTLGHSGFLEVSTRSWEPIFSLWKGR